MPAPDNAIPLGEENTAWKNPMEHYPTWQCPCGSYGKLHELLGDPATDNATLWCPGCKTAGWAWD